ncbi:MAG TPA: ABC transporter permease [Candidatus Polarisedimenticolaceae bacterium]|nr:ABC transporter permease [Candidatus Polarisedimenticolaceae bacterium]
MSLRKTLATTKRVLKQLRHDHRTLGMILVIPVLLITLLKYVFNDEPLVFNQLAPVILGIFPLVIMFLVTSIATLRERKSGTLDRLMTEPMSKLDLVFGYALAFLLVGLVQASLASFVTLSLLDVTVAGGAVPVVITAISAAFLGTTLGLFVSAFARNEFQAVQLIMPILMPQVLLCGLFTPRDHMAKLLQWLSDVLPLTYSVDAMKQAALYVDWTSQLSRDLLIVLGFGIAALILGSITIRRQE